MNALAPVVIEPFEAVGEAGNGLKVYQPFRAELEEFKSQNANLIFDYESPKGNKEARSHVYKLRQSKAAVDKARLAETAGLRTLKSRIDEEAKEIIAEIDAMIAVHTGPLDEIEQREKDRVDLIKSRIANDIRADVHMPFDATTTEIAAALDQVKAIPIDAWFGEFLAEAAAAKDAAVPALEHRLKAAQQREAEQAEIERLVVRLPSANSGTEMT